MTPAVITGVGLAVSGLGGPDDLLEQRTGDGGFVPAVRLAGRAMRHKDRASRFALRAAEAALQDAGLLSDTAFDGPSDQTAVVVSSNLGNLDSVCEFADVIGEHGLL
jgi:3-oxoacyl-[acyl-carrier-protein] synthase II